MEITPLTIKVDIFGNPSECRNEIKEIIDLLREQLYAGKLSKFTVDTK